MFWFINVISFICTIGLTCDDFLWFYMVFFPIDVVIKATFIFFNAITGFKNPFNEPHTEINQIKGWLVG